MQRLLSICVFGWLVEAAAFAGPKEDAILAAMRLSEQANYSWVASVVDDARSYDIHGKTSREGYSEVKMPLINSVRRQLARASSETDLAVIFRGNVDCVIETDMGWLRLDELPAAEPENGSRGRRTGSARAGGPRGRSGARGQGSNAQAPAYSNLQLALSLPHEELGVIVGSHTEWNVAGDEISGTLSDLGAQLLLVRDGQDLITPMRAAGTFRLWLRGGMVTKYQVRLEGLLQVGPENARRQVIVRQVTDTLVKDVGTTKVTVPDEARAKLALLHAR